MLYEWDEQKRAANKARHRVDFLIVVDFDWDSALVAPDDRRDYGEERFVSIGPINGRLHVLIFTRRDATRARNMMKHVCVAAKIGADAKGGAEHIANMVKPADKVSCAGRSRFQVLLAWMRPRSRT